MIGGGEAQAVSATKADGSLALRQRSLVPSQSSTARPSGSAEWQQSEMISASAK